MNIITDINERLQALECQTVGFETLQQEMCDTCQNIKRLQRESATLRGRLDDAEDRSRRENLIFFGIPDGPSENARQCEETIISIASDKLDISLPLDSIERAHRIGKFSSAKNRPLVVKLPTFKTKEMVFSKRSDFAGTGISVSEGFCEATRHARKKLLEFGIEA